MDRAVRNPQALGSLIAELERVGASMRTIDGDVIGGPADKIRTAVARDELRAVGERRGRAEG